MSKEIALEKYKKYTEMVQALGIVYRDFGEAVHGLNSCDQLWVIDEHKKWFGANYISEALRSLPVDETN